MNKLGRETSPYLLQHANNPVDWWPPSPTATARQVVRWVPTNPRATRRLCA
ncbi:DUF255 domain-containing protein [Nonomuraea sp. NPDC004702]